MKVHPHADRVLVRRAPPETVSKGGIVIPGNATERPVEGTVLAVGPGRRTDDGLCLEMRIRAGDKVLFGKYAGTEIKVDGEEFVLLPESDILATLTEE